MLKKMLLIALLLWAPLSQADDVNRIATFCKQQWPGAKGLQSYCIKNQRNYMEWLDYIRKRVFADDNSRAVMDRCIYNKRPNYQAAFDCYWNK